MKKIFNLLTAFLLVGIVFLIRPNSVQGQLNCKFLSNPTVASCGQGEYQEYLSRCQLSGYPYCCITSADCDKARQDINTIPPSSFEKFDKTVQQAQQTGQTNMQWYLGGDNAFVESAANSLTGLVIGRNLNWQELRAGNFDKVQIGGALGFTSNLVSLILTQPPISSKEYFADLGKNLGIVKPAYAQGIGFKGLSNLLPLWKASRNLAYILFVIIFLATGLAIMFRIKLDPKTAISIQNAIPKLIIALILVTFSYAIVGLLIDLVYVLIYIGVLAIGQTGWINIAEQQARYTSLSFLDGVGLVLGGGIKTVATLMGGWISAGIITVILGVLGALLIPVSGGLGALVAALPLLLLAIIALVCIFKLFFSLLSCYLSIIISLIIGPLQITFGVLPGNQSGFGAWFKNLLANILVFPAVALAILLGWVLTGTHGPDWTPPVLGASGGGLSSILGFAILMLLPKIPDMVKAAFKMKPAGYGTAIGEALGAPKMLLGKAISTGTTLAGIDRSYKEITGVGVGPIGKFFQRGEGGGGEKGTSVVSNQPR